MKKIFAIMMIAVFAIGMVFAVDNETHTLRIKADIAEVLPAFNLYHIEGTDTNSSASNVVALATPATAYSTLATNGNATDTGWNIDVGGNVAVVAEVINNVKTNKGYTLTFTGGVFDVTRNTVAGYYSPTSITVANGSANDAIKQFGSATDSSANGDITADTTSTLSASTSVTFSGKTGTGATTPITVATATYHYSADNTVDPNVGGTFYYADITLTIAAT